MYINLNTTFTNEQLETEWDIVAIYDGNIVAYRSKHPNGLLRIIDTDSMHDILEFHGNPNGNPHTVSIADARLKADKIMGA